MTTLLQRSTTCDYNGHVDVFQFHRLRATTEEAVVGHWPQITDLEGATPEDIAAYDALQSAEDVPGPIPRADGFELHRRAKLTDLLSSRFMPMDVGLWVSDRLKKVLDGFDLAHVRSCAMTFAKPSDGGAYHILYVAPAVDVVSFPGSKYSETNILDQVEGPESTFASADELTETARELVHASGRNLAPVDILLLKAPDLFRLPRDFGAIHISEKLKEALETAELTGLHIEPSEVRFKLRV